MNETETEYCTSYCDANGCKRDGVWCTNQPNIFCCGNLKNKTCCADSNSSIKNEQEPEVPLYCNYDSNGSFFPGYSWTLIYALVAVLLVILVIVMVCICCRGYQIVSRRRRRSAGGSGRDGGSSGSGTGNNEMDVRSLGFDPTCEYAFQPPRYETLPKDPPKYDEIFTISRGSAVANAAFEMTEDPIPIYAEIIANRSPDAAATAELRLPNPTEDAQRRQCQDTVIAAVSAADGGRDQDEPANQTEDDTRRRQDAAFASVGVSAADGGGGGCDACHDSDGGVNARIRGDDTNDNDSGRYPITSYTAAQ